MDATSIVQAPSDVGVNVAVYTVEDVAAKFESVPFATVTSPEIKSVVDSLEVKVKESKASSEVSPLVTSAAAIVMVGDVLSEVQVNCSEATLSLPAGSVNAAAATSIVQTPSDVGVNVAVYNVDDVAAKFESVPFATVTSPETKSVVDSLEVNVKESEASFEASPLKTTLPASAVIVIKGCAPS